MNDRISNLRPQLTEFFREWLNVDVLLHPPEKTVLSDIDLTTCIGKLILAEVFRDLRDIEMELFKTYSIIVSFNDVLLLQT